MNRQQFFISLYALVANRRLCGGTGKEKYPRSYRYSRQHEWLLIEKNVGTIGLTNYAQGQLGDIVYVDLPKPKAVLRARAALGSVESVKAVSDIFSPITGTVIQVNTDLVEHPELVNSDPHGSGWLVKLSLDKPVYPASLLTAKQYEAYLGDEGR